MLKYDEALERASSLQYQHVWLNWRAMGRLSATIIVAMVIMLLDIFANNHPNSWGMLIGLGIGQAAICGLLLLDWVEHRHMSRIFSRIRTAAATVQVEQAKKDGKVH